MAAPTLGQFLFDYLYDQGVTHEPCVGFATPMANERDVEMQSAKCRMK
jgi:hypothetical protein